VQKEHNESLITSNKLETESTRLKFVLAEKELESKLKDEHKKKVSSGETKF